MDNIKMSKDLKQKILENSYEQNTKRSYGRRGLSAVAACVIMASASLFIAENVNISNRVISQEKIMTPQNKNTENIAVTEATTAIVAQGSISENTTVIQEQKDVNITEATTNKYGIKEEQKVAEDNYNEAEAGQGEALPNEIAIEQSEALPEEAEFQQSEALPNEGVAMARMFTDNEISETTYITEEQYNSITSDIKEKFDARAVFLPYSNWEYVNADANEDAVKMSLISSDNTIDYSIKKDGNFENKGYNVEYENDVELRYGEEGYYEAVFSREELMYSLQSQKPLTKAEISGIMALLK